MVGGYAVDPAALQQTDTAGAAAVFEARQALHRLEAQVRSLLWQGAAGSAFRLAWEQWLEGAQTVLLALDELAELLGRSATGYATTDETVRVSVTRAAP
jgi:WXG100 family type VII secretion target